MTNIKDEVFLGFREAYNQKLERLANLAQAEIWSFGSEKNFDRFRILRNYFEFTYSRLSEENKIATSDDGVYRCMNTGLLTVYNQEIVAIFSKSRKLDGLPWYFNGFYKETDNAFSTVFSKVPELANYCTNPVDLIFDKNLDIRIRKEHIIDDNISRFASAGYSDKALINALLDYAKGTLIKKLNRNFKLALPFYYHNTETGEAKMQLLAPIYFPNAKVKLAFVLNRIKSEANDYYEAVTVLPVEWAYMNARVIARPDEEWAKIIEAIDTITEVSSDSML